MEVTLDEHGRIAVPKSLREKLELEAGTELTLEVEGNQLLLKPTPEQSVLQERDGLLVSTAEVDREIDVQSVIDEARTERSQNIADLENE
ncbi:MAG: AbrB/MazE/SpoVT family DNA-binding domain-containing protein [Salinibacter sp.]